MNQIKCRVMLTGGGSGGPTTPLLGLVGTLQEKDDVLCEFLFLGSRNGPEEAMVEESGIPFLTIPSGKLRRYWDWQNLRDPFFVLAGFIVGFYHLLRFRPDIVVSAGSFVSVPVAFAAFLLRIPHLILQMDVRPGLANRLMTPFSAGVACYFENSVNAFKGVPLQQIVGPVVRQNILNADSKRAEKHFGLDPNRPLLLITGGGQGAGQLNRMVELWLQTWLNKWQVVHLKGNNVSESFTEDPHYHPFEFIHKGMGDLLARSDLVITRAGMGTLGELSVLAKDALVIPMQGTHQEDNMKSLVDNDSVYEVNPEFFSEPVNEQWKKFFNDFESGKMGKKLYQVWSGPGNQTLSGVMFSCMKKKVLQKD